jgi:hypothetical protein
MTLYSRIQSFYKIDSFRFKERDKNKIGVRLSNLCKELHPNEPLPPRVQSIEDSGTYLVIDYPESFVTMIDQMLRNVHQEILEAARERRRTKNIPAVTPAPIAPLPKIRKRIPIKQK